ncbi:MAG: hypothetical protein NTU48_03860 [Legionellales bacterium]|nr:hypothetical protein [Legionellales bacterium]
MTTLFVFFVHGSGCDLKMVTKATMGVESVITLAVFYEQHTCSITISGSPIVIEYLETRAAWFFEDGDDNLALFKQLFDRLKARYGLKSDQIYASLENNWAVPGAKYPTQSVVDVINHMQPGTTVLPSGTPDCTKFSYYWMRYYNCPKLELNESFVMPESYYTEEELSAEKIAELNTIAQRLHLKCVPHSMAAFDKAYLARCVRILLDKIAAKKMAQELEVALYRSVKRSETFMEEPLESIQILATLACYDDYGLITPCGKPDEMKDERSDLNGVEFVSTGRSDNDDWVTVPGDYFIQEPVQMSLTQMAIEEQPKPWEKDILDHKINSGATRLKPSNACFPRPANSWLRFFCCCGSEDSVVSSDECMAMANNG